jgi:hypothetical protein
MGPGAMGNNRGAGAIGMMTEEERKSGFGGNAKDAETLESSRSGLGQSCPQQYPHPNGAIHAISSTGSLGKPMDIGQVAALLGCSAWTVRQRYLHQGLPHLRACASGKLVFFREQVIHWILKRQQQRQKGGQLR